MEEGQLGPQTNATIPLQTHGLRPMRVPVLGACRRARPYSSARAEEDNFWGGLLGRQRAAGCCRRRFQEDVYGDGISDLDASHGSCTCTSLLPSWSAHALPGTTHERSNVEQRTISSRPPKCQLQSAHDSGDGSKSYGLHEPVSQHSAKPTPSGIPRNLRRSASCAGEGRHLIGRDRHS